jgi:hypothetical protein
MEREAVGGKRDLSHAQQMTVCQTPRTGTEINQSYTLFLYTYVYICMLTTTMLAYLFEELLCDDPGSRVDAEFHL